MVHWFGNLAGPAVRTAGSGVVVALALSGLVATAPAALAEPFPAEGLILVAGEAQSPIDGTWRLRGKGTVISIRGSRSFDADTGQPLGRDIRQSGPASFKLFDIACNCRATMKITAEGTLSGISHSIVGPVGWELKPLDLVDPGWFDETVSSY
ncbi:MAG: hypothetical protein C0606_02905 [Hyphomicrobiales bacterium]|nr:MAG: hypothetical protein C0606_02905 [Hyphomicrobiales bacterium]